MLFLIEAPAVGEKNGPGRRYFYEEEAVHPGGNTSVVSQMEIRGLFVLGCQ